MLNTTMTDRNGKTITMGEVVDIIIAGKFQNKAVFKGVDGDGDLATIQAMGVKFRKGGLEGYCTQALAKYVYAAT